MMLKHIKIRPPLHVCLNSSVARPSYWGKRARGVSFSCVLAPCISTLLKANTSFDVHDVRSESIIIIKRGTIFCFRLQLIIIHIHAGILHSSGLRAQAPTVKALLSPQPSTGRRLVVGKNLLIVCQMFIRLFPRITDKLNVKKEVIISLRCREGHYVPLVNLLETLISI